MSATTATTTTTTIPSNKKLTAGDKAKAATAPSRTAPWEDLPATPDMQKEPRENSTISQALKLLRERGREGATLEEIQKTFEVINMGHHDAKGVLRFMSSKRGWGFHMKKDGSGKIVLRVKND